TALALCPNSEELHIYELDAGSAWRKTHVLKEHDQLISGVSWSKQSNKIVTCSHDRNAFVWSFDEREKKWMPTLCVLNIDRGALDVQWSPDGNKFAVASAAKTVPVCYYDTSKHTKRADWYVSKLIKKQHKSTVQALAWHPQIQALATVSTDFKCRVLSAYLPEVDAAQDPGPFPDALPFGELYAEYPTAGWANDVAWSPSGRLLAFASQDCAVGIAESESPASASAQVVRYQLRPLTCLAFLGETMLAGGGHDMNPLLFGSDGSGTWSFKQKLDDGKRSNDTAGSSVSNTQAARAMFQAKAKLGTDTGSSSGDKLATQHQNTISCMRVMGGSGGVEASGAQLSTLGMDGRLVLWEVGTLATGMQGLSI
ncbi:unnamed protein product, partial [Chrysoparadoxa australica]